MQEILIDGGQLIGRRQARQGRIRRIDRRDEARLIDRILFLEGIPNLQDLDKLLIGEEVQEIVECDLKLERKGIGDLKAAIADCEKIKDYATRELLAEILESEEKGIDFIESHLVLIQKIGIQNYIQLHSESAG